ncbi:hypothetical protein E8E12_001478 [Didymella heteroderae]|uniref:Uncharacterized protein n=1 Tax=Didymella heteroderae TaxID=1769908 RepID=A0A9P5BV97_9PLEO|nr:hypothetical protein E8E12_001478 [Didymella heteroderae]
MEDNGAFHPIACESCRNKKSKCDREMCDLQISADEQKRDPAGTQSAAMSEALSGTKRRRAREDGEHASDSPEAHAAEAKKRRAFLHTMGQQLREFGNEGVSPQDQSRNTFPNGDITERDDRLDLIDFLARHADIRGSIMQIRNKASVRDQYDDGQALSIETEHAKWWTLVDEHLSDHALTRSISKPHQVTLMVLRFETILALHRSILGNPKHDTVFNAALQRCITASRSIINTLHKALKGFGAFDGSPGQNGYESTPLLWPSFTWAIWMSTFIVMFAASEGQLSHKIAFGLADRSIEVLQHIALRDLSRFQVPRYATLNSALPATMPESVPFEPIANPIGVDQLGSGFENSTSQDAFQGTDNYNYVNGSGNFLGIAQQSSDIPRPHEDITQLFSSEDMTWWMGPDYGFDGFV